MAPRVMGGNFFKLLRPGGAFDLNLCATWGVGTSEHTNQIVEYNQWSELFYTLPLQRLDQAAGRALPNVISLKPDAKVSAVIPVRRFEPNQ